MNVSELQGKTLVKVEQGKCADGDCLTFVTEEGEKYRLYHPQDCCELVYLEDINGDLEDLVGVPLLMADEASADFDTDEGVGMWTFYRFATIKGYVNVTWRGSSNGYYSIPVKFEKAGENKKAQ